MDFRELARKKSLSRSPALAGEDGSAALPRPADRSSDADLSLKLAPVKTTRTGSCSNSCSRETSSRRQCGGCTRDGCSYVQSFPKALSSGLCRPRCMSPPRREVPARPAVTLVRLGGGRNSELGTAFLSLAANAQDGHRTNL